MRVKALVKSWRLKIPRVYALPDSDSRMLAPAVAWELSVSVEPWPEDGSSRSEPGLIVAYCLSDATSEVYDSLKQHRKGQVLWSHASPSFTYVPVAADITTFFYSGLNAPWAAEEEQIPQDASEAISQAEYPCDTKGFMDDLKEMRAFEKLAAKCKGPGAPSALKETDARAGQLKIWPVGGAGLSSSGL